MSIIHNALNKTKVNLNTKNRKKWYKLKKINMLYIAVCVIVIFAITIIYPKANTEQLQKSVFEGVAESESGDKIAVLNEETYKKGDLFNGGEIISITNNYVLIKKGKKILKLEIAS